MPSERDFIASCFEAFLGRELEADRDATELSAHAPETVLDILLHSPEFSQGVLAPLMASRMPPGRFRLPFTRRMRLWAADRLPLSEAGRATLLLSVDWWDFLSSLLADDVFMRAVSRQPMAVPPLPSWLVEERFERLTAQRQG